jgi:hypothetical protein
MKRRHLLRRFAIVAAVAALLGTATACEPLRNAPPGGGDAATQSYRLGPFDLAPMGQSGSEDQGWQTAIARPEGAFGMKSISFDLVFADGTPVPHSDAHLHHVVLMNSARRSQNCSSWPERFAATGSERTETVFGGPYAYLVGAEDQWSATWHVMNESTEPMEVYIEYEMGVQPDATAENTRGLTPFFLDITGCGNSEYDIPGDGGPGSVHTQTATWQAPWDGMLLWAEGHVHGGGIDITLENERSGDSCTMTAEYEHEHPHGSPGYITTCGAHTPFEQGDRYSVTARYENDEPIAGAMGIVHAYAWQGSQ